MRGPDTERIPGNRKMPVTPMNAVLWACHTEHDLRWDGIELLFVSYATPCFHFFRDRGLDREQAMAMLHDFILYLWEKCVISRYVREKGRFRTFLLLEMEQFRLGQRRYDRAACRAPEGRLLSLAIPSIAEEAERVPIGTTREEIFDGDYAKRKAIDVLREVRDALGGRYDGKGAKAITLYIYSKNPRRPDYNGIAAKCGLKERQVRHLIYRFREEARIALQYAIANETLEEEEKDQNQDLILTLEPRLRVPDPEEASEDEADQRDTA